VLDFTRLCAGGDRMKLAGISMIGNDADVVEAFVRHTLGLLDHLFVVVHCPQDGTREILDALQAEDLPITLVLDNEPAFLQGERLTWLTREAWAAVQPDFAFLLDADEFIVPPERSVIEAALSSLAPTALAAGIRLLTFVPTSDDPVGESHPIRRIQHRTREEPKVRKLVLTRAFAADRSWAIDHGNHELLRIGGAERLTAPALRQLALAHYPVRSAAQVTNKTIIGYLAHLAAGRPGVEERRIATHWRRCYEEMVVQGATRGMTEEQLIGWFHRRPDMRPRPGELVRDPTPAPDPLRYPHLVRNDPYSTLARFTEALIRSRPGQLDGVRFDHGPANSAGVGDERAAIERHE
jgi:hypothetical protein